MSFGISTGDFISVLQLANSLYKDVFLVARGAPEALLVLKGEIADLNLAIGLLVEETENRESNLAKKEPDRVKIVNEVMERTNETLQKLKKFAEKYNFDQGSLGKKKYKIVWDKFKWAMNVSSIDEFRSKIQYHNGLINLILTAAANSSLERIEKSNAALNKSIEGIHDKLSNSDVLTIPRFTSIGEISFQVTLSVLLLEKAEVYRPWTSTSLSEWWAVGRWFFTKAQNQLSEDVLTSTTTIPTQAFTDLIKASWIVTDVLTKHPQLRFWSLTSESMQVPLLAEMVNSQLQKLDPKATPSLDEIENADLTIWDESWSKVALKPSARSGPSASNPYFWRTSEAETIWQGFGTHIPPPKAAIEIGGSGSEFRSESDMECMISFLASKDFKSATILAQDQTGRSILSYPVTFQLVLENDFLNNIDLRAIYLDLPYAAGSNERPPQLVMLLGTHKLKLKGRENIRLAVISLLAIILVLESTSVENTRANLSALILLQTVALGDLSLIRSQLRFGPGTTLRDVSALWSVAERTASIMIELCDQSKTPPALPRHFLAAELSRYWLENYINCWMFYLFQLPVRLIKETSIEPLLKTAALSKKIDPVFKKIDPLENFHAENFGEEVKVLAPNRLAVLATIADDTVMLEKALNSVSDYVVETYSFSFVSKNGVLDPSKRPEVMTLLQVAAWSHGIAVASHLFDSPSYSSALICWDNDVSEIRRSELGALARHKEGYPQNLKALKEHLQCNPLHVRSCVLHQAINNHRCDTSCPQQQLDGLEFRPSQENQTGCVYRKREMEMVGYLLAQGANPNAVAFDGHTPLFHAIQLNQLEIADILLAAGAYVDATASNGKTCLHLAWSNGFNITKNKRNRRLVRFLFSKGAKDLVDEKGNSCLSQSLNPPSIAKVRFLLESGLDIRQIDMKKPSTLFGKKIISEAEDLTTAKEANSWFSVGPLFVSMHIGLALNVSIKSLDAGEPFVWPAVQWSDEDLVSAAKILASRARFNLLDDFYDLFSEILLKDPNNLSTSIEPPCEDNKDKGSKREAVLETILNLEEGGQRASPEAVPA